MQESLEKYLESLNSYYCPTFVMEVPDSSNIIAKADQPNDFDNSSTSFFGEFGYELISVLPFAYWLHLQGRLLKTQSVRDTTCLYFFSDNHEECDCIRTYQIPDTPNPDVHAAQVNTRQWYPPPLKEFYKNDYFGFEKPILIIHNKFSVEWDSAPINYFTLVDLETIFKTFSENYTIIYIRPSSKCIIPDHQEILDLGDFQLLNNFPDVIPFQKLIEKYPNYSYNHLQLLLHARCKHFISVQGGCSVLASYFSGTNLILAKKGKELIYQTFEHLYHLFSGCCVRSFDESNSLITTAKKLFL